MPYQLKENFEEFEMVDGPFAGTRYVHGKLYDKVPTGESRRFQEIKGDEGKTTPAVRKRTTVKPTTKEEGNEPSSDA